MKLCGSQQEEMPPPLTAQLNPLMKVFLLAASFCKIEAQSSVILLAASILTDDLLVFIYTFTDCKVILLLGFICGMIALIK